MVAIIHLTPSNLVAFWPSEEARRSVAHLIEQEKSASLTPEEKSELDHYMQLEHLMRLAKARARRHLARVNTITNPCG